jgi:hypothetical protein
MAWQTSKTNWEKNDTVSVDDFDRMENNIQVRRNSIDVCGVLDTAFFNFTEYELLLPITLTVGQSLRLIRVRYDINFDADDYPNPKPVYPDSVLNDRIQIQYSNDTVWTSASYTGDESPDLVLATASLGERNEKLSVYYTGSQAYVAQFWARLEVY